MMGMDVGEVDAENIWENAVKLEGLGLEEDSGFGGPGWSRSVDIAHEEEVECVFEAALLAVGAGAVGSTGGKEKSMGVFVEVLRDIHRFLEVGGSSV